FLKYFMVQSISSDFPQNEFLNSKLQKFTPLFSFYICGNLGDDFFYANLTPLHEDEAGYWFNLTHKVFANRSTPMVSDQLFISLETLTRGRSR
ncbi:uncharacterized protein METZ01_LOCUS489755, partial [marine metagenome]